MIKGQNEFRLNEATVMAAIEEYLNARIVKGEDELEVSGVMELNGVAIKQFRVYVHPKGTTP